MHAPLKSFGVTLFLVSGSIAFWSAVGHWMPLTQLTVIGGYSRDPWLSVASIVFVLFYAFSLLGFETAAGWIVGQTIDKHDARLQWVAFWAAAAGACVANALLLCPAYQYSMNQEFGIERDHSWLALFVISVFLAGVAMLAAAIKVAVVPHLRRN